MDNVNEKIKKIYECEKCKKIFRHKKEKYHVK
jgi:hypothetical protein